MSKILKLIQPYITETSINSNIIKRIYDFIKREESTGDVYDETNTNFIGSVTTSVTYKKYIDDIKAKFPNFNISANSLYILFAYELIENTLKNSIGDGVGISYDDAQRKIISNNLFTNISEEFEFDEFKYFTATLQNAPMSLFRNCTGLKSINCDNVITILSINMFEHCNNLENIYGINNVVEAKSNCFSNCMKLNLTQSNFPALKKIYDNTFKCCGVSGEWDLTNFDVVEGNPFQGADITKLVVPDRFINNITIRNNYKLQTFVCNVSLRTNIFDLGGCPYLEPFVLYYPLITNSFYAMFSETWDSGRGALHYQENWTQMYFPNLTSTVNKSIFYSYQGNYMATFAGSRPSLNIDLVYFGNSLEEMDYRGFNCTTIKALIINRTNPPKIIKHDRDTTVGIEEYEFTTSGVTINLFNIYVPDTAVELYKLTWPTHATHIFGISTLNSGVSYQTEADWRAANKPIAIIEEYTT